MHACCVPPASPSLTPPLPPLIYTTPPLHCLGLLGFTLGMSPTLMCVCAGCVCVRVLGLFVYVFVRICMRISVYLCSIRLCMYTTYQFFDYFFICVHVLGVCVRVLGVFVCVFCYVCMRV